MVLEIEHEGECNKIILYQNFGAAIGHIIITKEQIRIKSNSGVKANGPMRRGE